MYFLVAITSFLVYRSNVNGNILHTIPKGPLRIIAEILLLLCNVLFSTLIVLNPFSQDMEELLQVPRRKLKTYPEIGDS